MQRHWRFGRQLVAEGFASRTFSASEAARRARTGGTPGPRVSQSSQSTQPAARFFAVHFWMTIIMTIAALLWLSMKLRIVSAVQNWIARRRAAEAIDELRAMDDRMLADRGLTRGEIVQICLRQVTAR